jgi:hypothetical protein
MRSETCREMHDFQSLGKLKAAFSSDCGGSPFTEKEFFEPNGTLFFLVF